MKSVLKLSILSLLLPALLLAVAPAQGQVFQKIFGKKKAEPRRRNTHTYRQKAPQPAKPVPSKPERIKTVMKSRYRVDVLASLYLDELIQNGKPVYKAFLPNKVLPGLNFYQGVQLAADTLNRQGFQIDVFIHDITQPATSVDSLLARGSLDSSDLVIGAVSGTYIGRLAALAKKRHINFVSTISPSDGNVSNNPFFTLLQPTLEAHCEAVRQVLAKRSALETNLLIYDRSSVPVDKECYRFMTRGNSPSYTRVVMDEPMPDDRLRNFLDSQRTNVIVMPIIDAHYAAKLLEQLGKSFPKYSFEVYGMPSWKGMKLFERAGALPNVAVSFPSAFYYDPTTPVGKAFSDAYAARFGGRPGALSYRGYEVMLWYANLLRRYGTLFNNNYEDDAMAPFTRFDVKLVNTGDHVRYYENRHVYLYRYQGGNLMVSQ